MILPRGVGLQDRTAWLCCILCFPYVVTFSLHDEAGGRIGGVWSFWGIEQAALCTRCFFFFGIGRRDTPTVMLTCR